MTGKGITETGFVRATYDDILKEKIRLAQEFFGDDIDTSEQTAMGKFLRIQAYEQNLIWELAEYVYNSIYPNTAFGTSLDRLCVFVGIKRNAAVSARYIVKVTGSAGATIPQGFLFSTDTGLTFATLQDEQIGEDGTAVVYVDCTESGVIGNITASAITIVTKPTASVKSVLGLEQAYKGSEAESDEDLRNRFYAALEGSGSCNAAAIRAALLRIPTVISAGVIVNDGDSTDEAGRPPRSFECYVQGGEEYHTEIAETIFDKMPIGIKSYGDESQEIVDEGGYPHTIYFSHTEDVPVYVRMQINTDATFESDGNRDIKNNIANYIANLGVGKSAIFSALYGEIHSVTGVTEVVTLQVSTDKATWNMGNIDATQRQSCTLGAVLIWNGTEYVEVT